MKLFGKATGSRISAQHEEHSSADIPLAVRPLWKVIFIVNTLGCVLYALAGFRVLWKAAKNADIIAGLLCIVFFGGGGLLTVWMLTRPQGRIEVRHDGLFIQSYFTIGMADWSNLEEVGVVKTLGISYFGIRLENAERYLASRATLNDKRAIHNVKVVSFALRAMFTLAKIPLIKQIVDYLFGILGFSAPPDRLREIDFLEYNQKNFGYHIIFPVFLVAEKPAQLADDSICC